VDLSGIRSFDDLIAKLFAFLGLPGVVILLIVLAFKLSSYIPALKFIARIAGGAFRLAQLAAQYKPVAGAISIFAVPLVPIAHLVTVAMVFLAANYLTAVTNEERGEQLEVVISQFPQVESVGALLDPNWYIAAWDAVRPFLELNLFTGWYTLLAISILINSYTRLSNARIRWLGYGLGWPSIIWCLVAFALLMDTVGKCLLALLFEQYPPPLSEYLEYAMFLVTSSAVWLVYLGACKAAVWTPRLILRLWVKRTESGELGASSDVSHYS